MTKIVGILNVNKESFYDGGKYINPEKALIRAEEMITQGVDIIEIGGFSTKPGSEVPSINIELERIIPVIQKINILNIPISIDTTRYEIVREVKRFQNVKYINDTSGMKDERILQELSGTNLYYVLMHMVGEYKSMNNINPVYDDINGEIEAFFQKKLKILEQNKIQNIIIDPGFFFHKGPKENISIIKNISNFKKLGYPIFVGLSRKSNILKNSLGYTEEALIESYIMMFECLKSKIDYLRVHDINLAKHLIQFERLYSQY